MKLGQFCDAILPSGKHASLTNSVYQSYKSSPAPFTIDGVTYSKITKHSTTIPAKAMKTRWWTYSDGTMMEVIEGEEYSPRKDVDSVAYRSVKTWYEVE